jgi:flavorubredoxin
MHTKIAEIADGIYRLSTYVPEIAAPAGFTFNQFLVLGDEPLIFHTGLRKMFPLNREALRRIVPPDSLRFIAYSCCAVDARLSRIRPRGNGRRRAVSVYDDQTWPGA